MGSEQYKDIGTVSVVNASQIVIGASTDFSGQLSLPCIFKVNRDDESTYSVGAISSATRVVLAANYLGSTDSGVGYIFCRSFTTNRGFWRPLQGDKDFAEILSQDTIDKIDDDMDYLYTYLGAASLVSSGSLIAARGTLASVFAIHYGDNVARMHTDNLTASRNYRFPDANATLAGLGVEQSFSADQTINASLWVKGNASIEGVLHVAEINIADLTITGNASINGNLDAGGDSHLCGSLHVCGNASVDGTFDVAGITTMGNKMSVASTIHGKVTASIDGDVKIGGVLYTEFCRHINIPAGAATLGPAAPTPTTIGTARGLGFDADGEQAFFNFEVPHNWDGMSDLDINVFWSGEDGDVIAKQEHVKHKVEYRIVTLGSAIDAGNAVIASTIYTAPAGLIDKQGFKTTVTLDKDDSDQPVVAGESVHITYSRHVTGEASSYSGLGIVYRWQASLCVDSLTD